MSRTLSVVLTFNIKQRCFSLTNVVRNWIKLVVAVYSIGWALSRYVVKVRMTNSNVTCFVHRIICFVLFVDVPSLSLLVISLAFEWLALVCVVRHAWELDFSHILPVQSTVAQLE